MESTLLMLYGKIEWRQSLVSMLMATSLMVKKRHPMLSKKVTATINVVPLFHGQVSRMLDGMVCVCIADIGRLWNPTARWLRLWMQPPMVSASMRFRSRGEATSM